MTYRKFVRHMMKSTGLAREDVQVAISIVLENVRDVLLTGDSISLPRLGTLFPYFPKKREWVSPSTGDIIEVGNRYKLKFRASRKLEKQMTESIKRLTDDEITAEE